MLLEGESSLCFEKGGNALNKTFDAIAVDCILRSLTSKCACSSALDTIPYLLASHQLGLGITALQLV